MFQLREADNLQPQILTDPKEERTEVEILCYSNPSYWYRYYCNGIGRLGKVVAISRKKEGSSVRATIDPGISKKFSQ